MYNPIYEQVHIAAEDFPGDLGRSLQAYYLETHGLTDGKYIEDLLEKHSMDKLSLFNSLESHLENIDEDLKWYYGLTVDTLNRDPAEIAQYTDVSGSSKFREITKYDAYLLRDELSNTVGPLLSIKNGVNRLTESHENETLHEYYARVLDASEYPNTFNRTFEL
jgi:hypothetical protein